MFIGSIATGWWLTYPSEKYEFVSWDDEIPNMMESHKIPWFQTTNQFFSDPLRNGPSKAALLTAAVAVVKKWSISSQTSGFCCAKPMRCSCTGTSLGVGPEISTRKKIDVGHQLTPSWSQFPHENTTDGNELPWLRNLEVLRSDGFVWK